MGRGLGACRKQAWGPLEKTGRKPRVSTGVVRLQGFNSGSINALQGRDLLVYKDRNRQAPSVWEAEAGEWLRALGHPGRCTELQASLGTE